MMAEQTKWMPDFMRGLSGSLLLDEPMSKHTTWRTGGIAEFFYTPASKSDLVQLLQQIPGDMSVHWVGLGSNLLVRDGGIPGMVIRTSKGLNQINPDSSNQLYVESGVSCAKVARTASLKGLSGVEFLAGVPGSFGGALAMNAGAFGGEIWDWVTQVECVNRAGELFRYTQSEVEFSYRHVSLPTHSWLLNGTLKLDNADSDQDGRAKIRSLLEKRSDSQPIQSANAGSVFRNPQGDYSARLIESVGLKGFSIGDAVISPVHANFIVNRGNATSRDIEQLMRFAQEQVLHKCGIELQLEVRIIGHEQPDIGAGSGYE